MFWNMLWCLTSVSAASIMLLRKTSFSGEWTPGRIPGVPGRLVGAPFGLPDDGFQVALQRRMEFGIIAHERGE